MLFGQLMKEYREKQGLSQEAIGNRGRIGAYEREEVKMSLEKALSLAEILNIPKKKAIIAHLNSYLINNNINKKVIDIK